MTETLQSILNDGYEKITGCNFGVNCEMYKKLDERIWYDKREDKIIIKYRFEKDVRGK